MPPKVSDFFRAGVAAVAAAKAVNKVAPAATRFASAANTSKPKHSINPDLLTSSRALPKALMQGVPPITPSRRFSQSAAQNPNKRALFIGYGNMAKPMLKAFRDANPNYEIVICSPNIFEKKDRPEGRGISIFKDPKLVPGKFDDIFVAIKPQYFDQVLPDYADKLTDDGRVISVAAGKTIANLQKFFPEAKKLFRVMPNTPMQTENKARGNEGVAGIYASPAASKEDVKFVRDSFAGTSVMVANESEINGITAISGSGPAYFFYLAAAINQVAQDVDYDLGKGPDDASGEGKIFQWMQEACKSIPEGELLKDFREKYSSPLDKEVEKLMSEKGTLKDFLKKVVQLKNPDAIKSAMLYVAQCFIDGAAKKEGASKNVQFSVEDANNLVMKTMEGAAALAIESNDSADGLRAKVTSPSGTTFYGLKVLMDNEVDPAANKPKETGLMTLQEICNGTLRAACDRALALGTPPVAPSHNGASNLKGMVADHSK